MPPDIRIRTFQPGDEQALWRVFHSSVRTLAAARYDSQQLEAWSPGEPDIDAWNARIRAIQPFVALVGDEPVGYADLQSNGYIVHFFVAGAWARRGVGTALMNRIEEAARAAGLAELRADVSLAAEAFFLHCGFAVVERHPQHTVRGVNLPNARMRKDLQP